MGAVIFIAILGIAALWAVCVALVGLLWLATVFGRWCYKRMKAHQQKERMQ